MNFIEIKIFVRKVVLAAAGIICSISFCAAQEIGKPAPQLTAKTLDGESFQLSQTLGSVVIINFWATWCSPCRQEMPALEAYYQQHKVDGLRVVAISMDDPKNDSAVRTVMKAFSFSAGFEREADYRGYGRIWRMPMTFVIDRQGILRKDGSVGKPTIDLSLLETLVTPLLNTSATSH
ncbi:MAG TPA: TlpA disulfide reductase family protein [Spongiibacteraceae bacterium]|jgi:peroxiredoxin